MARKRRDNSMGIIVKPIQTTPELTGRYAKEFISEVMKKPSEAAVQRNKKAQDLLRRMKR